MAELTTKFIFSKKLPDMFSFQEAKDIIINEIEKILEEVEQMYVNNRVIVIVKTPTDEKGCYDSFEVDVYPGFAEANDYLNTAMYNDKLSLSVYEYCTTDKSITNVMDKIFNGTYYRLAGISKHYLIDDSFLAKVRKVYDLHPTVNLYI